jgi:hypothetical protein
MSLGSERGPCRGLRTTGDYPNECRTTLVARVACEASMHSEEVCIIATISAPARSVREEAQLEGGPVAATLDWGSSVALALLAFARHDIHSEHDQRESRLGGDDPSGVRRRADVRRLSAADRGHHPTANRQHFLGCASSPMAELCSVWSLAKR